MSLFLNTTDTLRAVADTDNVVAFTVTGDEVATGTDSFEILAQGLVQDAITTIYTTPASTQTLIKAIHLANTTAFNVTGVTFYVNGAAAANQINGGITIPANGGALYDGEGWHVYDSSGIVQSVGGTGPAGTIAIGTVTTVPDTAPATVTNVGTPQAAILDFEIPQGEQGIQGLPGVVQSIVPGQNIDVDNTDPANPIVAVENLVAADITDVTASASELNILDGATLSTAELNYVDGVTSSIQTQLNDKLDDSMLDTDGTLSANSDAKIPSQKAVKTYSDQLIAAADALVFKGVIDASVNPNYPAADKGWTYRISVAGKIGGGSGINVEVGDLLLCLVDGSPAGTQAAVGANWSIAQVNIDGAVVGPASATDNTPAVYDGASGKLIKNITYAAFKTNLVLVKGDVGLGNVDNTSDVNKPVSTAQQSALDLKANLASPALTGNPTAPTPSASDNDTSIATTAFVNTEIAADAPNVTLTAVGATPNANAASLSGQALTLQPASASFAGLETAANYLRTTVQPRNAMSDVPGGVNCKMDGIYRLDATMASGTSIINSAGATFTAADVGKICGMNGAGIGGATLYGTITTFNSATQVVVSFQASTTVAANGVFIYGTDDLAAYNAILASGGRWIFPDWNELNNLATRMLFSNAPNAISEPNTQIIMSGGITNYDVSFNERGNFIHIMRSNNPNTASATLGVTQLTGPAVSFSAVIGASNQALKGVRVEGFTVECAGNIPIGVRGTSSHKGCIQDIHVKNPAYRAYDFTTVGGALGEATDYSKNYHQNLSARNLDGVTTSTTAAGAVGNLFANANLVLTSSAGWATAGGMGIAMTTINGAVRPTLFSYTGISVNTLTGITCLYTIAGQSAALANLAVVAVASPYWADGFVLDGDPNSQNAGAGNAPGNTSLNVFMNCSIVHANGSARRYLNSDSNKMINFCANRSGAGTGIGTGYWGSTNAINTARNNLDLGGDPGAGGARIYGAEMGIITANPLSNRWYDYELGNGAPRPVNGTGGAITTSDFTCTFNGALSLFGGGKVLAADTALGAAGATGQIPGMFVLFPSIGASVGTMVKFRVLMQKTAAGTSLTFALRWGTANTTADGVAAQGPAWTGTAAIETAIFEVTAVMTAVGAAATLKTVANLSGRSLGMAATTGFITTAPPTGANIWTAPTFNSGLTNPNGAYLGLYVTANTGTVLTALAGSVAEVINP